MAVKIIKELGVDQTEQPNATYILQTMESNLDVCTFTGSPNLQLSALEEFQLQDVNGNVIFQGEIRKPVSGDTTGYTGFDYGIQLGEIPIRKNYENKTPLEIIEDVITNFTGLTYNNTAGVSTTANIPLYPTKNKYASEIIDEMHALLGTTHYVDKDKNFYIEYEGSELNSSALIVGENCWIKDDGWVVNTDTICRSITVNGGTKATEETTFLSGTGSQTEFTTPRAFNTVSVEYPVGTLLQPYINGVNTGDYQINKETKKIIFDTAPAIGTDNIKVIYTYDLQANFTIESEDENPHHVTVNRDYLKEVEECILYADRYLERFKNGVIDCELLISGLDITKFRANQRIRVIDNYHKVNGSFVDNTFIIKKVERSYGQDENQLIVTVGTSEIFVFDREKETSAKVVDLNETITDAEIFNEGINTVDDFELEIQYRLEIELFKADLPDDILVYNANRTFTKVADLDDTALKKYKYIKADDLYNLFERQK